MDEVNRNIASLLIFQLPYFDWISTYQKRAKAMFQEGMVLDWETFSILTTSPPFIINVIFSVLIVMYVLYFQSEGWKEKLWNVVLMCYALLFIFVYIGAWFVRLKYNLTPSFNESFALGSFSWMEGFFHTMDGEQDRRTEFDSKCDCVWCVAVLLQEVQG